MMLINISFININGLGSGKIDTVKQYIEKEKIDVMILVETWLRKGDHNPFGKTMVDIRKECDDENNSRSRGSGGIIIIVRPTLRHVIDIIEIDNNNNWVKIKIGSEVLTSAYYPIVGMEEEFITFWNNRSRDINKGIIVGDLNARMGSYSGDHFTNRRGTWLKNYLIQSQYTRIEPIIGKWTSINQGGRGIPDHLIAPFSSHKISNFTV